MVSILDSVFKGLDPIKTPDSRSLDLDKNVYFAFKHFYIRTILNCSILYHVNLRLDLVNFRPDPKIWTWNFAAWSQGRMLRRYGRGWATNQRRGTAHAEFYLNQVPWTQICFEQPASKLRRGSRMGVNTINLIIGMWIQVWTQQPIWYID